MTTQPSFPNSTAQNIPNNSAIMISNNNLNQPGFILANNGQHIATSQTNASQGQPFMFAQGTPINAVNQLGKPRPQFVSFGLDGGLVAYTPNNLVGSQQQVIRTSNYNQMLPNLRPIATQANIQPNQQNIQAGSTIFMSPIIGQTRVSNQLIANNGAQNQPQFAFAAPALATVSMLPNGQLCVTQSPQNPVNLQQAQLTPTHPSNKALKLLSSKQPLTPTQNKNEPSPSEVLKQLNLQIDNLANLPSLTDAQNKRLKELKTVRDKLIKATNNKKSTMAAAAAAKERTVFPEKDESSNDSLMQKNTGMNQAMIANANMIPTNQNIPNNSKMEILSKLQSDNLLPKCALSTAFPETFIVEFRMTNQRFQLRMTRYQKEAMEKLLAGQTPKRQSEFLSVFQQEQSKIPANTTTAQLAQTLVTNNHNSNNALLRPNLSATSSLQPPGHGQAHQQSFFINGQQIAFSPQQQPQNPQQGKQTTLLPNSPGQNPNNPAGGGQFRFITASQIATSSTAYSQCISANGQYFQVPINMTNASQANLSTLQGGNLCIRQPIVTNAQLMGGNTILSTGFQQNQGVLQTAATAFHHQQLQGQKAIINNTTIQTTAVVPAVPRIPLTPAQTKAMMELRRMYQEDVTKLSTHGQLMGAKLTSERPIDFFEDLYYYHVAQDHDNTPEALEKTDTILEEALSEIMKKKSSILNLIDELTFCENELYTGLSRETTDNYLQQKLTLELEKEALQRDKELFSLLNAKISEAEGSGDFKDVTDGRFCNLSSLKVKLDTDLTDGDAIKEEPGFSLPKPRGSQKRRRSKSFKTTKIPKFLESYRRFLGPLVDFPIQMELDLKEDDFDLPSVEDILDSWAENPESVIKIVKQEDSVKNFKSSSSLPFLKTDSPLAPMKQENLSPPPSTCNFEYQNSYQWDEDMEENSNSQFLNHPSRSSVSQPDNEDTIGSYSTLNPKSKADEDEIALLRSLEEAANDIEYLDAPQPASSPNNQLASNTTTSQGTTDPCEVYPKPDNSDYFDESNENNGGIHSEDPDIDAAIRSILSPSI